jgi:hypothetical protein
MKANIFTGVPELSEEYLKQVQQMPRPPDMTNNGDSQASSSNAPTNTIKDSVSKAVPKWLSKGLLKK